MGTVLAELVDIPAPVPTSRGNRWGSGRRGRPNSVGEVSPLFPDRSVTYVPGLYPSVA